MRVLVAIDGSRDAHKALDLVGSLAWPTGTTIRILEVIEIESESFGGWPLVGLADSEVLESRIAHHVSATVSAAERHLGGHGFAVEGGVIRGRPASAIVDDARRFGADLIVLGSRGHGTIEAMVLGSVSAEVIARSSVPVLVVRGSKPRLDRILVAWDESPAARAAAELIKTWPMFGSAGIRVLSVADVGPAWWAGFPPAGAAASGAAYAAAAEEARGLQVEEARALADELRAAGRSATEVCRDGRPAAEIMAAAGEWPADLIVMGTHARHGLSRFLLGSVARNVLLHADCSVLVVPNPAAVVRAGAGQTGEPLAASGLGGNRSG
jgi:nucleotide-binding universal stress UspA family protein